MPWAVRRLVARPAARTLRRDASTIGFECLRQPFLDKGLGARVALWALVGGAVVPHGDAGPGAAQPHLAVRQLDALEELGRPEEGRLHHAVAVERRRQVGAVRRSQRDPLGAGGRGRPVAGAREARARPREVARGRARRHLLERRAVAGEPRVHGGKRRVRPRRRAPARAAAAPAAAAALAAAALAAARLSIRLSGRRGVLLRRPPPVARAAAGLRRRAGLVVLQPAHLVGREFRVDIRGEIEALVPGQFPHDRQRLFRPALRALPTTARCRRPRWPVCEIGGTSWPPGSWSRGVGLSNLD